MNRMNQANWAEFYVEKTVYYDSDGLSDDDEYTLGLNYRKAEIPGMQYLELKRLYEFLGKLLKQEERFIQRFNKLNKF